MKSILVHLDASPRSAERLALAQRLAAQHGAEVTAIYAVTPALLASPWGAGEGMAMAVTMLAEMDQLQRARALALFERAKSQGPLIWEETNQEPLYQPLTQRALFTDLLVLGQTDPHDTQTGAVPPDLVPSLVTESGKPALVLPYAGQFGDMGHEVLLAWKPTREAARAVNAALPLLRRAHCLHVAYQVDAENPADEPLKALAHWLHLQGVQARLEPQRLPEGDVGEALLSLAADTGAGLLVMGCYGHSRAREWVLGGVTRSILKAMTLPVLMAR